MSKALLTIEELTDRVLCKIRERKGGEGCFGNQYLRNRGRPFRSKLGSHRRWSREGRPERGQSRRNFRHA
jgi:hypothetical protein